MMRTPATLRAVALDLGATRFRVAVGNGEGEIEWRVSTLTEVERGVERVLEGISTVIEQAVGAAGGIGRLAGIGVAAPGPLDPWKGVIYTAPNMPGWDEVHLKEYFEERFGLPTLVGNDANLAAVGEHRYGAGRGFANIVYVTVSTGIGGGVITDDRLLLGANGFAGEIGHITIDVSGPVCGCGNRGCLEALASGTAIARAARELVASGARTALAGIPPNGLTAKVVTEAAYAGDEPSRTILRKAGEAMGVGAANLANLFNPSRIVLGGGVAINAGPIFWDAVLETLRLRALRPALRDLEVVRAGLGDDAGLLGAVALVVQARAD